MIASCTPDPSRIAGPLGQTTSWTDVGPERAPSIETLVAVLAESAAGLEPDAPLWAYGYDQRQLSERRHPTADDLDRAAPGRAVYVMHASGHGAVVSTAALAQAGIGSATQDVLGGEIGRGADGRPDGRLMDAAWDLALGPASVKIGRHGPNIHVPDSPEALLSHLEAAQREILGAGITTVFDAQVTRRELEAYLRLRDAGRLRMRVNLLVISSLLDEVLELGLVAPLGDDWLRFAGIKLYADGTLIGRTAFFPDGYPSEPEERGLLYHDPAEYGELLRRAKRLSEEFLKSLLSWQRSGFSAHADEPVEALDAASLERLARYVTRAPIRIDAIEIDDEGRVRITTPPDPRISQGGDRG